MVKSFFTTIVALLFSTCLFGQTPSELVKHVYPKLYKKYSKQLSTTPSCHYFLIDASGSIKDAGLDIPIINALKGYLNGLPDNDFLTIIIFGETLKTKAIGIPNALINSSTRFDIINEISKIQFDQQRSDTYTGLDKMINSMEQAGHEEHQKNVFILTDFLYNSKINGKNLNKENWGKLQSKMTVLKNTSSVNPQAIQLLNGDFEDKSNFVKPKLDQVLGEKISYESCTNSTLLNQKFKDITANILKKKLEGIVNQDAKYDKNHFSIEMKNVGIKLLQCNLYSKIELSEKSQQLLKKKMEIPLFSFLPPSKDSISIDGLMIAENYKYFEGTKKRHEMEDILQDYSFQDRRIEIQLKDSLIPWWLTDIIVLILLLSIFRFIWTIIPVSLHGMITFSSLENFNAANNNTLCSGKKTVSIGVGHSIANDSSLFGNDSFSLSVTAKKAFFKGKCIELVPINGDLKGKKKGIIIQGKHKKLVDKNSFWLINGVTIGLPGVK